ncbi:MAG: CoA-transferase, partial [Gammaproteobacteria bacterium]
EYAAQGRMDAFFVGGGQIDGQGNINLVGIGDYPGSKLRLPGSFGSAYLYHLVPNIVLFRKEHSRRVLVPKVDFVSAAGTSPANHYRIGGPRWLVTELVVMEFNANKARFSLTSIHPGHSLEEVLDQTGFEFDYADQPAVTATPTPQN